MAAAAATWNKLKRKNSRWQQLPVAGQDTADDAEADPGRYSLLLFIRDLELGTGKRRLKEFVQGLEKAPGVLDERSTMAAVLGAALDLKIIDQDYMTTEGRDPKRRRVEMHGNQAAGDQMEELTELITLARSVWTDPDDLRDIIGELFTLNVRKLIEGGRYDLPDIFDWARSWAEVRYRFLNHSLRDDPHLWLGYNSGPARNKGDAANALVHESNVVLDARMVEFRNVRGTGFADRDRDTYSELYLLTPEQGRRLIQYSGVSTGLRPGLPGVFDYIIDIINTFMNWRVRVLESARKQILADQAYRNARGPAAKNAVRTRMNPPIISAISNVDNIYTHQLIPVVTTLLDEAERLNAFQRATYDRLENVMRSFTTAVTTSTMNTFTNDLRYNHNFQTSTAAFPGPKRLIRPTGTALIAAPRR
ncbi:hypothetical protein F5Y10DRAFT_284737 [Nemania abortiva]|nr:hypothetical protein F5Y10DRAFT_284737 [Nemania abortiva]